MTKTIVTVAALQLVEEGRLALDAPVEKILPAFAAPRVLIGGIWRFADEWSAFASWSKGFTLPNVGIPLRNINTPGHSVNDIADLQAIVVKNTEVGIAWRGERGGFSASTYRSTSDLGVSLSVDPVSHDFVMNRVPVNITGFEFSSEYHFTDSLKATLLYSRTMGNTWFTTGGPLTKHMGVNDINPDKIGSSLTWKFSDRGDATLGETTLRSRMLNPGTS
ncbi:MAG: TonB-dependent receptor, partial [Gammaproteobacteria bacterium]